MDFLACRFFPNLRTNLFDAVVGLSRSRFIGMSFFREAAMPSAPLLLNSEGVGHGEAPAPQVVGRLAARLCR